MAAKKQTKKATQVIEEDMTEMSADAMVMPQQEKVVVIQQGNGLGAQKEHALKFRTLNARRKENAQAYRKEKKVSVSISPTYKAYFGRTAMISVNGVAVYIPCDGRSYLVNETHAAELLDTLSRIDAKIQREDAMASVEGNIEKSPGALQF